MNKDGSPLITFTWEELLALDQLPRGCLLAFSDANLHQRENVERHILTLGLSTSEAAHIVQKLRHVGLIDKNGDRIRAYVWAKDVAQRGDGSPGTGNANDFDTTFLRKVGVLID
jgi:hypothetical protein